jgi:hypothetical protein
MIVLTADETSELYANTERVGAPVPDGAHRFRVSAVAVVSNGTAGRRSAVSRQ